MLWILSLPVFNYTRGVKVVRRFGLVRAQGGTDS